MGFVLLVFAIAAEVVASVSLRLSEGFSRWLPAAIALGGFGLSLVLLSLAMKTVPLSVSYPMWAGIGTVGTLAAAWFLFGERLVPVQWAGIGAVVLGVVLLNLPKMATA